MKVSLFTFALGLGLITSSAQGAVWQETQSWNSHWESTYSRWVETSFNEDIFVSGPYKNIATDCSDAVYAARIIFSYENGLPFVIRDATGGSNRVTNRMSRFDGTPDSLQRVRKFIQYVGDITSTSTLPGDTYPVAIHRNHVRPGTVWSRPRIKKENFLRKITGRSVQEDPGHAEIVKSVSETGAIFLIGSTVPKAVRSLNTTSSLVFMPIETSTGLRNWMLPEYYGKSASTFAGYSLEQFDPIGRGDGGRRKMNKWTNDVQRRLALRQESRGENISRQVDNICSLVNARADLVKKAEAHRLQLRGTCMNAADYDSYSTPSRDKRIKLTLKQVSEAAGGRGLTAARKAKSLKAYLDRCSAIEIAPGQRVSLYHFSQALLKGDASSDPNDSLEARWGLGGERARHCPSYE